MVMALGEVGIRFVFAPVFEWQNRDRSLVITVPKSAVRHDEGEAYVWTVREGIVRRVSVVCGLTTETGIEVRQGLKDGDSVVITPDVKLVNGGKVSVR